MGGGKKHKEKLFQKFAANLDYLFQNFRDVKIEQPLGGGYLCPVAYTIHSIDGIKDEYQDQLTLEHVPPKALGGKPACLVRKDINSQAGHSIDKSLIDQINAQLFVKGKSSVRGKLRYNLSGLKGITTDITIQPGEKPDIVFNPGEKNMALLRNHVIDKGLWHGLKMNMTFSLPGKNQDNRVAYLKYAYLLAFSKVGYSLLFGPRYLENPHYQKVRRQIMAPKEEIIPFVPVFKNAGPRIDGLGVVLEPEQMKSLFVTFPLTWQGHTDFYTVFLPAPDDRGFTAYDYMDNERKIRDSFDFEFQEIPRFEFWKSRENAIMFHQVWKDLNDN